MSAERTNRSNTAVALVRRDPRPGVVHLEERAVPPSSRTRTVTVPPPGVCRIAFDTRLLSTSAMRTGSASIVRHVVPIERERDAARRGDVLERPDRVLGDRADVGGLPVQHEHALVGHRQRPQVLEQPRHHLGLVDHAPQALASAG